ncbi:diguanylate cyclase [Candidatus Moduliflexota bacterium]
MKILVVEDTPTQAAMIKMGLQRLGHTVVQAKDGLDAIEKVYQEMPDLVVSDVVMPRLNGYQVCRLIKDDRQTAGIPVILLTSLDQKQDMFWGLKSGADKFITKGGDIPSLVDDVGEFIRNWYGGRDVPLREAASPAGDLDFDVMERVVKLLDRNLFESTVISEIQNLVNVLDDYDKTIVSVMEIFGNVIDFNAGYLLLTGGENVRERFFIHKSVDVSFLVEMREEAARELGLPGRKGAGPPADDQVHDPGNLLGKSGDHPAKVASLCASALNTKGSPGGIIALASAEGKAFSERTVKTFGIISRQANIVIDYARLYERTKQLSITDGLTKVYNHRYFQEQLRREYARSGRHGTSLSLAMLDIDHFKRFNDTYGHQQGDIVLRELARLLQSQIRSVDLLARYGGEEFAVIMPETEDAVCLKVAERLRTMVKGHAIPGQDRALKVTVSMGLATVPRPDIASPAELISAADQALYRAKENGRNRVER